MGLVPINDSELFRVPVDALRRRPTPTQAINEIIDRWIVANSPAPKTKRLNLVARWTRMF